MGCVVLRPLSASRRVAAQLALQQTKAFRYAACGRILFDALAAELSVSRTTTSRP